jgi:fermentation-respiration switch protein FrsA (DUF1100 family)
MAVLKWSIGLVIVAYGAAVAVLFLVQGALLFPVPQTERTIPSSVGFPQAEEHKLTTSDGETVIVWHVPPKDGKPVVLFFHGNGDILVWRVSRFRELTQDGIGLVALSYRGYAGSTGRPSEPGLLRDAEAAYAFAAQRYSSDRIVVWGFSLGSGVATALAAEKPVRALILEAPYTSTADVAAGILPMIPVRWLMRDQFRSDERIGQIKVPILVMHGERDPAIPIALGRRLFSLAHEPKRFVTFREGGHENLDQFGAVQTVREFIGSLKD